MLLSILTAEFKHVCMTFLIAMTPVLELRGSIPYGAANDMPFWENIIISAVGNIILTPLIILFVRSVFNWLRRVRCFRRFVEWSERHVLKKEYILKKYEVIGLAILVAIPLPGTGAWTGAMLAGLLNMRMKSALPAIVIGVIIAAFIVGGVSYGFVGALSFFGLHN